MEKEIKVENLKLDEAYENYKELIQKNLPDKFTDLDNWLYFKSKRLMYEVENPSKNKWTYKRGSIVRVNFGVNIGKEFSQQHFAIVISKKDNLREDLVTVVPLTSKEHKDKTIPLDSLIMDTYVKKSVKELDRVSIKLKQMAKEYKILIKKKETIARKNNDDKDSITELELQIKNHNEQIKIEQQNIQKLMKIISIYKKCSNLSYANVSQIKVVSKSRIMFPINEYDITNGEVCSKDLLRKIDKEIIRKYTGLDFPKIEKFIDTM